MTFMPVACVADWSRNHDKTSLSHCHTHTHMPAHSLIKQSARRARRQPNVNATPGDYFDLQLPHAAAAPLRRPSTWFNLLRAQGWSMEWGMGRWRAVPIQLEICASAASYRKTLPMLNVCVSYTPVPSLPSQHSAQHMPCMQHCCKLNTRTCRATNLRVSLLALRCGILFASESVRVC